MAILDPDPHTAMPPIRTARVLLADDDTLLRDLLANFLREEPEFDVTVADDLNQTLAHLRGGPGFGVIVIGYDLPGSSQLDAYDAICSAAPNARIALLLNAAWPDVAFWTKAKNVAGFLPKTITGARLVQAIKAMASGQSIADTDFLNVVAEEHPLASRLSRREIEALACLVCGLSNKQIARRLNISEPTVKMHAKSLYRKIGAANRTQAAMIARQEGLF
ncbi:response regulator transcription factor [Palleronia abyssalis]|uniref:Transcriptional regulatory protein DegU n=1 Tax=Palleronia abyssalis TaxID=1501240 RepID=A0A2R8BTH9_9RHOB|nr:response regulator transcription factor [Palleronia abyssalis]SPJ23440.1 Transcriptional regulatory protein DegU [Palleronia abyssalis]